MGWRYLAGGSKFCLQGSQPDIATTPFLLSQTFSPQPNFSSCPSAPLLQRAPTSKRTFTTTL
jgi:hypothetical protein